MYTALRQHIEEIVPLTDEEFNYVQSFFVPKKLRKHQFLLQEGDAVTHEYFVVSGLLKASYINESGREYILQFAMENWWISDYQALHHQAKAGLTIDCIEPVELLGIAYDDKQKLCAAMHSIEHFFRVKTTAGYVGVQQRLLSLLSDDAQTRYQQLFGKYPVLFQRIPKTLIAAYLGVSRETLSRFPGK